jgi:hypothetical protein
MHIKFLSEKLKDKEHLEDLGVGMRIISIKISKNNQDVRVLTGFNCVRASFSGGFSYPYHWIFGFHK